MSKRLRSLILASLTATLPLVGCGDNTTPPPDGGGPWPDLSSTPDAATVSTFIRVHYRLQGAGDPKTWGAHFWGAGSTSPDWGKPQVFDKTDDFGAYTDIKVSAIGDVADGWLGLIPVQCSGGNCKKDVETAVRFFDLTKNAQDPRIAECWITQGQAVQITKPQSTGPAYKITRSKDFIDLGNGSVRLMFRVPAGSTGTVKYGAAADKLDKQVTWAATDNVNDNGLMVTGLTPGTAVYYKIDSSLKSGASTLTDSAGPLSLTPIAFTPVSTATDWASWGGKGLMYQLLVRTFADGGGQKAAADPAKDSGIDPATKDGIGDLVGLKAALPYLRDLGVDAIWMTPVFKSKSYHGYDTTDFYDIDPAVGTRKDFVDLTTAAHVAGIKIILDLVENHVADVNPWFVKGSNPKDPEYAKYHEWFVWSDDYSNMLTDKHPFDTSAVIWACKNYQCYHEIFGAAMPELNFRNPEVRAEMKKISKFWIDLGADGFRLDASKHIDQFDDNNSIALDKHGTHVWWKEFNYYVKKTVTRPVGAATVLLAGENRWDDPAVAKLMVPYASDMDSQFDFPFRTYLSNFFGGKTGDPADFVKYLGQLQKDSAAVASGGNANHYYERFLSNHDLDRPATQFGSAGAQLDAVLKQAATIVLTVPGMPVVYYGEEFGKAGKRDKFLGNEPYDHDEFIREPMSWFKALTFSGDGLKSYNIDYVKTNADNAVLGPYAGVCKAANPDYPFIKFMKQSDGASWAAQKDVPDSLLSYYKKLISIRRTNSILSDQDAVLATVTNTADAYEYSITKGAQVLTVVLNRKSTAQTITRTKAVRDLLTGVSATSFTVPAYGALILQ